MAADKALFIPLRTKWFHQFETGVKRTEYRAYGPRWNERTCKVDRLAVLSHGYSGHGRIRTKVTFFQKLARDDAPQEARDIYPAAEYIAAITFALG